MADMMFVSLAPLPDQQVFPCGRAVEKWQPGMGPLQHRRIAAHLCDPTPTILA